MRYIGYRPEFTKGESEDVYHATVGLIRYSEKKEEAPGNIERKLGQYRNSTDTYHHALAHLLIPVTLWLRLL